MQTTEQESSDKMRESLTKSVFIDTDDLNEQNFPDAKKRLRNKILTFFLPAVAVFIALFSFKAKGSYDYILFFVILIFSATVNYLIYQNNLWKLKFYFYLMDKR